MKPVELFFALLLAAQPVLAADAGLVAAKPLYRDPVYDGAADPTVIWNPIVKRWWMFYTNRRANVPGLSGVTWVHGTPIGIAESADGGAHWQYVGTAQIELPAEYGGTNVTEWAPDVTRAPDGTWQMFLTVAHSIEGRNGHLHAAVATIGVSRSFGAKSERDRASLGSGEQSGPGANRPVACTCARTR